MAGAGPSSRGPALLMTGGAAIETFPFGVATAAHRRMAGELGDGVDEAIGGVGGTQLCRGLVAGQSGEGCADVGIDRCAVGDTDHVGFEAGALGQVGLVQEAGAEVAPLAFVLDRDQHQCDVRRSETPYGHLDECARPRRSGARPVSS